MTTEEFWNSFLTEAGKNPEECSYSGELQFENTGAVGQGQLALLLSGAKSAMFSSFDFYLINRLPLPVAGELYLVKDSGDKPRCIIELTGVQVVPFGQVTWEMARLEGEDEDFASWKDKQRDYLAEEAALSGFEVNDSTKLLFETFRVIYRNS